MLTSLYLMRDLRAMGMRVRTPTTQMGRLGVMTKERTCKRVQRGECRQSQKREVTCGCKAWLHCKGNHAGSGKERVHLQSRQLPSALGLV